MTQVEEILDFFDDFIKENNAFGALAVSYYCRSKLREFSEKAEVIS